MEKEVYNFEFFIPDDYKKYIEITSENLTNCLSPEEKTLALKQINNDFEHDQFFNYDIIFIFYLLTEEEFIDDYKQAIEWTFKRLNSEGAVILVGAENHKLNIFPKIEEIALEIDPNLIGKDIQIEFHHDNNTKLIEENIKRIGKFLLDNFTLTPKQKKKISRNAKPDFLSQGDKYFVYVLQRGE